LEEYSFCEGDIPADLNFDFEISLFNRYRHIYLQAHEGWVTFYILKTKTERITGFIHFRLTDGQAYSPFRAPFGGLEFSDRISPYILFRFLEFVEANLRKRSVKSVTIKNPPQAYRHERLAIVETLLFNIGYSVIDAEVGAVMEVNRDFVAQLDTWEKRKLNRAKKAEFLFKPLSLECLAEVYSFILSCRQQKGYSLSMTLADLLKAVDQFPDNYIVSGVYTREKIVAASIAIRVNGNVLYNFYSDHDKEYDAFSPVVSLVEGLYKYCGQNDIALLDLGTSAWNRLPNFGLLDFKLRLGSKATSKLTFKKEL
jgi:hypothetical protein